jgi:excisionase family DNA binding protein
VAEVTAEAHADPPPTLLTPREVAALFRVAPMTVYRMIERNELPAVRLGRSFRVPTSAVREMMGDAWPADAG